MKKSKLIPFFIIFLSFCFYSDAQNISGLKGVKRILLVYESPADSNFYLNQKTVEKNNLAGFKERDLEVIKIKNPRLLKKYGIGINKSVVLLIGKDGFEKVRRFSIFSSNELFRIIDAMPMRKDEIKNQRD